MNRKKTKEIRQNLAIISDQIEALEPGDITYRFDEATQRIEVKTTTTTTTLPNMKSEKTIYYDKDGVKKSESEKDFIRPNGNGFKIKTEITTVYNTDSYTQNIKEYNLQGDIIRESTNTVTEYETL